jgi:hypothetical protein
MYSLYNPVRAYLLDDNASEAVSNKHKWSFAFLYILFSDQVDWLLSLIAYICFLPVLGQDVQELLSALT